MMHSAQVSKWEMKAAPRLSLRIFVGPLTAKELSSDIRLRKCTDGHELPFAVSGSGHSMFNFTGLHGFPHGSGGMMD
jgi:hypothetical protein